MPKKTPHIVDSQLSVDCVVQDLRGMAHDAMFIEDGIEGHTDHRPYSRYSIQVLRTKVQGKRLTRNAPKHTWFAVHANTHSHDDKPIFLTLLSRNCGSIVANIPNRILEAFPSSRRPMLSTPTICSSSSLWIQGITAFGS